MVFGNRQDLIDAWNTTAKDPAVAAMSPHHIFIVPAPATAQKYPLASINLSLASSKDMEFVKELEVVANKYAQTRWGTDAQFQTFVHSFGAASMYYTHLHLLLTNVPKTHPNYSEPQVGPSYKENWHKSVPLKQCLFSFHVTFTPLFFSVNFDMETFSIN